MKSPKPQTHSETGETGDYFYAHIVGESLVEPGELTAWKWVFLLVFVWRNEKMNGGKREIFVIFPHIAQN